jgi:hypothetical protein
MATEVTIAESEPEIPATQGEVIAAETAETVADASVEIAQIEADKEIAIAEIAAETVVAATEAEAEARAAFDAQAEIGSCRQSIETLQTEMTGIREAQALILSRLTPAEEAPPNPDPESAVGSVDPQEAETAPTEKKPQKRKRFRLI